MASTAEDLNARIAALEQALAKGERQVTFGDRSVTYNDSQEIVDRIAYFRTQLRALTGVRPRQSFGVTSSGF